MALDWGCMGEPMWSNSPAPAMATARAAGSSSKSATATSLAPSALSGVT